MALHKADLDIESIIAQIKDSKKYRRIHLCEDTIRDLIIIELNHHKRRGDAIKAARKKLHRVVAPYLNDPDYTLVAKELESAFQSNKSDPIQKCCAHILEAHASTKERLPILNRFYNQIFSVTGRPSILLDLACGLSPLSFPWMGLPNSTRYFTYDIHTQRVDFLNRYFSLQGLLPLAKVQDILIHPPKESGDVAFILKEVHRFEQRQRGSSLSLFDALNVCHIVVSLPTQNLTGRWHLADRHRQLFYSMIADRAWPITELEFENELVFCVNKSHEFNH